MCLVFEKNIRNENAPYLLFDLHIAIHFLTISLVDVHLSSVSTYRTLKPTLTM